MVRPRRARVAAKAAIVEEETPLVLVVDDNVDAQIIYGEYLAHAGYRVEVADDGASAVEMVRRLRPAIVVMDLEMPVLDGWSATRKIKSNPLTQRTCVIVVTGHASPEGLKRAHEAGANEVQLKPLLPEHLVAVIRRCCPPPEPRTTTRRRKLEP